MKILLGEKNFCKILSINAIAFSFVALSSGAIADVGDATATPAISGYGKIHAVTDKKSLYAVSPHAVSKLAFQVSEDSPKPALINPALEKIARAINLMVANGVPIDHLNVVVLIGGSAADAALDNAAYRKNFGIDNPNADLLRKLHAAGVSIVVSDQALAAKNLDSTVLMNVASTTMSSFTAMTSLEQAGYRLASM